MYYSRKCFSYKRSEIDQVKHVDWRVMRKIKAITCTIGPNICNCTKLLHNIVDINQQFNNNINYFCKKYYYVNSRQIYSW